MKTVWLVRLAACAALTLALPAAAQDAEDEREIVIEVDEQGRLVVDGEPVSDEGRVVVRISPDVEVVGPGERFHVRVPDARQIERLVRRADPGRFGWDGDAFARRFMADFEPPHIPHIPGIEPMLDGLRFEFGGDIERRVEEHREVAELEKESRELAERARRAEGAERADLEAELRQTLEEIFEKKMEIRRERVERLEERLEEQHMELNERSDSREDLIEHRMEQLLGESDELEW